EALRAVLSGIEPLVAAVRRGDPEHRLGTVLFQLDRLALHVDAEPLAAEQAQRLVRRHVLETQLAAELGGRRDASRALLDALRDLHLGELARDDAGFHLHRGGRHAVDLVLHHCDRRARLRGAAEHHRRHRGAHCHHSCPHQHCLLLAGLFMVSLGPEIVGLPWRAGCALAHTGVNWASVATSTSAWQTPSQNRLLAALPAADLARLQPHLELVPLPLGWAVYEAGGTQGYVY